MPTYTLKILSIDYGDSKEIKEAGEQARTFSTGKIKSYMNIGRPLPEIDQATAYVEVSVSQDPVGQIVCNVEADKKKVVFRTHRNRQNLDLILVHEEAIKGRFHFLKSVINEESAKKHGFVVEYYDPSNDPPWQTDRDFDEDLPGTPQRIRLVFKMKGKVDPFNYDIFIRDQTGHVQDMPCDPQASNEPPKIGP